MVFADFDPVSWCITADSIEAVLTPRTKAVIVVDLYGNMPDFDPILELCRERNVAVIEDAAEAVGATYKRRPAGSFGECSAFSFHGSKTLTTGEGGILLLDDEPTYRRCLALRDHGRAPGDMMYWSHLVGQKYRMSSMQAALGMAQLERLPELISRKRKIFDWYCRELADVSGITLNSQTADVFNTYWMVTAVLEPSLGWTKEKVILAMREHDIDCRPFFHPLSMLPAFSRSRPKRPRSTDARWDCRCRGSNGCGLVEGLMDFRPRPIFFERHAGHFLICNECKRAVWSVPDHVSHVDQIEDAPDRRCLEGIVGSTQNGLCHQLAIVVVLGEQTSRVLRKPLQWMPVLVAF